jgi:hypothetical protein
MEAVALPASKNGIMEVGVLRMPVTVNEFKKTKKREKKPWTCPLSPSRAVVPLLPLVPSQRI